MKKDLELLDLQLKESLAEKILLEEKIQNNNRIRDDTLNLQN